MQGLSLHINNNPEKLREHFVKFEGKKTIEVIVGSSFIKGFASNPWEEVIDGFSEEICSHVGKKTHNLLTPKFSTTGRTERVASQIVLMDCFKQYFCYHMVGVCGIPWITLQGTVHDWKKLRRQALGLRQYDLDWWIDELEPILDQFVDAASGNVDKDFWVSIYKLEKAYFKEIINGWILTLFPYLKEGRNQFLRTWKTDTFQEKPAVMKEYDVNIPVGDLSSYATTVSTSSFALGVVSVPFEWICLITMNHYPMNLFGGFMAATQDPDTLAIHPEIGWAVAERKEVEESKSLLDLYSKRFL